MKTRNRPALLLIHACREKDPKIEDAAKASGNDRAVLEDHAEVQVADKVVTLAGTVTDQNDRASADTAENLPGVTGVKNQFVDPAYPEESDEWTALEIYRRWLVRADVSATTRTDAVKDGVAAPGGTADNPAQKERTEAYARDIDGVRSVKNEMVVQAPVTKIPTLGEKIDGASIVRQLNLNGMTVSLE